MKAIVDADSFAFRAAVTQDDTPLEHVLSRLDYGINIALDEVEAKDQVLFLGGRDNFRYKIYPEYKNFRQGKERPKWEQAAKRHIIDQWDAKIADGMEGDDACGIENYKSNRNNTIIIHQDKDLNQLEGHHYNFVKKEKYYVTPEEGIYFFYYQLLVGDRTDAIKGVAGIGPKKAEKLLLDVPLKDLYGVVRDQYSSEEEMDMNAQVLYIWRRENDSILNNKEMFYVA